MARSRNRNQKRNQRVSRRRVQSRRSNTRNSRRNQQSRSQSRRRSRSQLRNRNARRSRRVRRRSSRGGSSGLEYKKPCIFSPRQMRMDEYTGLVCLRDKSNTEPAAGIIGCVNDLTPEPDAKGVLVCPERLE